MGKSWSNCVSERNCKSSNIDELFGKKYTSNPQDNSLGIVFNNSVVYTKNETLKRKLKKAERRVVNLKKELGYI